MGKSQKNEKNQVKSIKDKENTPLNEIKSIKKTKQLLKNHDICYFTEGNSKNFCNKIIDAEAKDHRKKNLHNCCNYFCPLCCESEFQDSFFKKKICILLNIFF